VKSFSGASTVQMIIAGLGLLLTVAGIAAVYDTLATDKEVVAEIARQEMIITAGIKAVEKKSDSDFYDRRVGFAEIRKEIYCDIKHDRDLCTYWKRQLRKEQRARQEFLRKK
jgi:hypothetical protein